MDFIIFGQKLKCESKSFLISKIILRDYRHNTKKGYTMAIYSDKLQDSFHTKLKVFLFTKAFDGHILTYIQDAKDNIDLIREGFNNFVLTKETADVYSGQYYQFESDKEIVLNDKKLKSSTLVENLMDKTKYIISTANLKEYLGDIYDRLKKDYALNSSVITPEEFKELVEDTKCSYCGISTEQIAQLGEKAQLHNKRSETRGYTLEIDRKEPNLEYTKDNCCMSCYWCNNAKTDEFSVKEFKEIARGINAVWNERMQKAKINEHIDFPMDI